jgi:hypothetical protein
MFWLAAALLALAIRLVRMWVSSDGAAGAGAGSDARADAAAGGYRQIAAHPLLRRTVPLAFFLHGGSIAVRAPWAGPWMTRVAGHSAAASTPFGC